MDNIENTQNNFEPNYEVVQEIQQNDKKDFLKISIIALLALVLFLLVFLFASGFFGGKKYTNNLFPNPNTLENFWNQNSEDDTENQNTDTGSDVYNPGYGIDTTPSESTSKDCNGGKNDDYLHPERFINPDGTLKCADGVVIFDHQITPKFIRTIIPYVKAETGYDIDLNLVDFYITLPATGEEVVYKDIFNWYVDGKRTIFNTNELLWEKWGSYIGNSHTYDFGVKMIHRPTGADISIIFNDHTTMTLYFDGLNGN